MEEVKSEKGVLASIIEERDRISRKRKIRLLYILMCVSIAAVVVFAVGLGYELYTSWRSQHYYSSMSAETNSKPRPYENISVDDLLSPPKTQPGKPGSLPDVSDGSDGDTYVDEGPQWEPYVDFEALRLKYPGISGWILCENTLIDYPLMQWTNNSYFLNHLPDGTNHKSGSIFIDYRSSADFTDKNTVIYGHWSRTRDMFGSLGHYRQQSYYEDHPIIFIFTPEKDFALVLFAGYLLDSGVEVPPMTFKDDEAFENHIRNIKRRSYFKTDIEVTADDRIVSLATCAYEFVNARWIIVGKLVEIGSARTEQ